MATWVAIAGTTLIGAESGYRESAEGLMKKTILERYGMEPWMREWAPGQAFNNTYMTRAPQFTAFTVKADGNKYLEESFDEKLVSQLDKLGSVVVKNEDFQRHVNELQQTWEGMLALNDGGMKRFSERIECVAKVDFKLKRIEAQLSEVREELLEVEAELDSGDQQALEEELGDLLFAVVNIARYQKIDPEQALRRANQKFEQRFHFIETHMQKPLSEATIDEMNVLWDQAKRL